MRKHGCPGLVIRNVSILHIPPTGELVEVLTRVDGLVQLVQQVSCCLYAPLGEAVVLITSSNNRDWRISYRELLGGLQTVIGLL